MSVEKSTPKALFVEAVGMFEALVHGLGPGTDWTAPALGVWDVRALVGHTSRALSTVIEYVDRPTEAESLFSAAEYFVYATQLATDPESVAERGREAGRDLGEDLASRISELAKQAVDAAETTDDAKIIAVLGGSIELRNYLPTRVFELVVHSMDIGAATGTDFSVPDPLLLSACELATQIAIARGQGADVVSSLTGRSQLPEGFSVLG